MSGNPSVPPPPPPPLPSNIYSSLESSTIIYNNILPLNSEANIGCDTIESNKIKNGDIVIENGFIKNVKNPIEPNDTTTKQYVDLGIQKQTCKNAVRVASTNNIILLYGLKTIDGISLEAKDRLLVKNQTQPMDNGIYIVSEDIWSRALDFDIGMNVSGSTVAVAEGNINANTIFICTSSENQDIVGTNDIIFTTQQYGPLENISISGYIHCGGDITCNEIFTTSDQTLKRNITPLKNSLNIVTSMKPVEYSFIGNNKKHYGILAQDILQIPELAPLVKIGTNGNLSVNYLDIVGLLVGAVKEIKDKISELETPKV